MLEELVRRISLSVSDVTDEFEVILVNDASPDESWIQIKRLCSHDKRVKGINLSRNFGQHYAISAGLALVTGDWIIVMDCDLQDCPEEIPRLYEKTQEGFDIVYARRIDRKDGYFKRFSSTFFHVVFDWFSGMKTDKSIANFGIFSKQVIAEFNKMPEKARSFGSLIGYLGFRIGTIDVEHSQRGEGKSSYNLAKLLKLSFDIIISNSNKPLRIATTMGLLMAFVSFILAIYNIVAKLMGIIQVPGFTTTVFSIWFVGGILLFVLGIIGLYIGKIFDQVKDRPLFVIKDSVNINR